MDYYGYHLAASYNELTPMQAMFIDYGRSKLEEKMNGADNKKLNKYRTRWYKKEVFIN